MKCSNCGAEIKEGAAFCPKCGTKQAVQVAQTMQGISAGQTAQMGQPAQEKKSRPSGGTIAGIGIAAVASVCLVVAIFLISYFNSKSYLYKTATTYLEEGNYAKAETTFSRIEDYEDSGKLLAETWYRHAKECMEAENYDEALDLLRKYEASSAPKSAAEDELVLYKEKIANGCRSQGKYEIAAELYQEMGKIWEAAETFAEMGNYLQAIEQTKDYECNAVQRKTRESWYRAQGILYANEGKYEEAWEYMKDYSGDYGNYDDEWCLAAYKTARTLADSQKYEEAILIAKKVEGHIEKTGALLKECYEGIGIAFANQGDYETAWGYFQLCDVTEAAQPYLYAVGQFYVEQNSYPEAMKIWELLGDYQDSTAQQKECYKLQAEVYEKNGEYKQALQLYEIYGDADLVTRCNYNWAMYVYRQNDYDSAIRKFTELGDYEDSAAQLKECYKLQAEVYEKNGEYEQALQLYEICGDADLVTRCNYNWAMYVYRQNDYDSAIRKFTELGDYKDSAEMLNEALKRMREIEIENDKKEGGELVGTWDADNKYYFRVGVWNNSGDGCTLTFLMRRSGETPLCGIDMSLFDGADGKAAPILGDIPAISRYYYWGNWDYEDGILYVRASGGGWNTFTYTVYGSTMTLNIDGRTFTLTKHNR